MNKKKSILFPLYFFILYVYDNNSIFGQQYFTKSNPIFHHYQLNKIIYSPTYLDFEKQSYHFIYNTGTGPLSKIREIYFDGFFQSKNNVFGFSVFSEQESVQFSKNKLKLQYAIDIPISKFSSIAFGSRIGLVNVRFAGTNATSGGSETGLDLDFGVCYRIKKFSLGLNGNQLTNSVIRPIGFEFYFDRYLQATSSYIFTLSPDVDWESGLIAEYNKNFKSMSLSNMITIQKIYGILLSVNPSNAYSVGLFTQLPMISEDFYVSFSYKQVFLPAAFSGFNQLGASIFYSPKYRKIFDSKLSRSTM